jgi:hypothetical protein
VAARPLPPAYGLGDGAKPPENRQNLPIVALHQLWQDGAGMNENEKQFSFTRATSSTSGRAKNQTPISTALALDTTHQLVNLKYVSRNCYEQDEILCSRDLFPQSINPVFRAGHSYPIRSTTVLRSGTKLNLAGGIDHVQWDGQELVFFITDEQGVEQVFMEGRLTRGSSSTSGPAKSNLLSVSS